MISLQNSSYRSRRLLLSKPEGLGPTKYVLGALAFGAIALPNWVFSPAGWANPPQSMLLAQQIVDGLPPPPLDAAGQPYAVPMVDPAAAAPAGESVPVQGQQYAVMINGNSPLLLEQVQRIEPNAQVLQQDGQTVIQAGVFDEESLAQQQVNFLAAQGIMGEVVPVAVGSAVVGSAPASNASDPDLLPLTPVPNEVVFGESPTFEQVTYDQPTATSSYYIVIPGKDGELPDLSEQVRLLGQGFSLASVVQLRQEPLGPHVLVGPFADRDAAQRWNRYFRDFGMNARVYYQR